uniref:Phosphatidic acid phosphatase type 2/haloperoxidase domain-containing protein n=1 Tax=Arion vulgaris TaxID=1028688 RepID=A0A0B6YHQ2_9EUPU
MTALGQQLLQFLGDSNLTAKFQQMCGIRNHFLTKCTWANGNGAAGVISAGMSELSGGINDNRKAANNCNLSGKSEANGHEEHHCRGQNHNNHISNGLSKDYILHRRNGYRNGLSPLDRLTNILIDHKVPDMQNQYENGTELKTNHHASGQTNTICEPVYTIENSMLYYLFIFGAGLGNELFYILFFSSTLWNFDSLVIRKLLIVWCVIMYVGQAAKDIIRWPRPKSPPVIRLEERYELEYGMPSTHAMVGVAIPFGMIIFMSERYEFNHFLGYMCAVIWSLLVSLSRLYLGMHSVLDIIAGVLCSVSLMAVTVSVLEPIDSFLMSHPMALPVTIIICIALCLIYPSLEQWSTARGDTTLVLGVFSGIYAGMWLTGKLTDFEHLPNTPPYTLEFPSAHNFFLGLLRQTGGLVIIILFLTFIKMVILHSLSWLCSCDPKDPKTKQRRPVELPYKYVSYYISAMASTYLIPLLFLKFNIERPSYYTEIFNQ